MNPCTAAQWIAAYKYCTDNPKVPAILARVVAKKYSIAMQKAKPYKPPVRLPRWLRVHTEKTSLPMLKKELDRVFSIFTRQKLADPNGMVACVTCRKVYHWRDLDAGHYQPRQDLATRWEENNVWPQCRPDNAFRGGEPEKMAAFIEEKCGSGRSTTLRAQARQPFKPSRQWLESKITHFKGLIHE